MTKKRDLKSIIRERMDKTGESYAAAHRNVAHVPERELAEPRPQPDAVEPRPIDSSIRGWQKSGPSPQRYEVQLDRRRKLTGNASARLRLRDGQPGDSSAMLMQQFLADKYRGKRLRLSAWIACESAGSCSLWMQLDVDEDAILYNQSPRTTGTSDWVQQELVLEVDDAVTLVSFGIILAGQGTMWLADVRVDVVGLDVPTTASRFIPEHPQNLDFAE